MSSRVFRMVMAGIGVVVAVVVGLVAWSIASDDDAAETAPMLLEYDADGELFAAADQLEVGSAELTRDENGLTADAEMSGLRPGGAYTFWLVVYQGEREFPGDIFVNHGQGVVADAGEASITGFYVDDLGGDAEFSPLVDPMNGRVRVEVVYHGQAEDAGDDLDAWLADFWTGDPKVCANPLGTVGTGAIPTHPYCAGYWASTFEPDPSRDSGLSRSPSE
jgi:hypothetical protein